jgi:hypothetical protein
MYELFYKYLIVNQKIGLPGVGNFYVESIPAKIDIVHSTLSAPTQLISFSAEAPINDRSFFDYISREMRLNGIEAVTRFNEFSQTINERAINSGAILPGIGTLKKNEDGEFSFYPEIKNHTLLPNININDSVAADAKLIAVYDSGETKIITQETVAPAEEKIILQDSDDFWWVYAIILALMGLGALLYYYI